MSASIQPGDVISYRDMCNHEGASLQRGMNFRLRGSRSVILMSLRRGAPYEDRVQEDGQILIYEGHDVPRTKECPDPKRFDQSETLPSGSLTQNGLFYKSASDYKTHRAPPERVRVYDKLQTGIWAYAGVFELVDAWKDAPSGRQVFKFKLQICDETPEAVMTGVEELEHSRLIPADVKLEVWKRDKGKCVLCGSNKNLHFDHVVPFSKGGTSLLAKNIQLLCATHNFAKRANIE